MFPPPRRCGEAGLRGQPVSAAQAFAICASLRSLGSRSTSSVSGSIFSAPAKKNGTWPEISSTTLPSGWTRATSAPTSRSRNVRPSAVNVIPTLIVFTVATGLPPANVRSVTWPRAVPVTATPHASDSSSSTNDSSIVMRSNTGFAPDPAVGTASAAKSSTPITATVTRPVDIVTPSARAGGPARPAVMRPVQLYRTARRRAPAERSAFAPADPVEGVDDPLEIAVAREVDGDGVRRPRERVRGHPVVDEEQRRVRRPAIGLARGGEVRRVEQRLRARERERRLLQERLIGGLVPGRGATLVLGEQQEPAPRVDHPSQRRPR